MIHPKHAQYVGKYSVHGALRGIPSPYWAMQNRYIQKPCIVVDQAVYYCLMFRELDQKSIGSKDWIPRFGIAHELQPKFSVMESSIRAVSIFWKLSSGLENDLYIYNTLFKKRWYVLIIYQNLKNGNTLFKKRWLGAVYQILTVAHMRPANGSLDDYVVLPIHMGLQ